MIQLLALRKEVSRKLNGMSLRQLRNRVRDRAADEGILDRDVALLSIAVRDAKIDIQQPRFKVPNEKISALNELLNSRGQATVQVLPKLGKRTSKEPVVRTRQLLKFRDKYPIPIFYNRLEDEINIAFNDPGLPNAVLLLSRKLIENLVYNLLEYRFNGSGIALYYDTSHRRAHDFSVLVSNLRDRKSDFDLDLQDKISTFLKMVEPFRREANSNAHKVMEYLGSMRDVSKLNIPEMTQILLQVVDRVRPQTP